MFSILLFFQGNLQTQYYSKGQIESTGLLDDTGQRTGYLRTSWQLKTFKQNTIRTRIIIKKGSSNPLSFKIKLISEESRRPLTSVKSDELYREWDRVLRKYKDIIQEMQSRL
jgi:hypothetical protein